MTKRMTGEISTVRLPAGTKARIKAQCGDLGENEWIRNLVLLRLAHDEAVVDPAIEKRKRARAARALMLDPVDVP